MIRDVLGTIGGELHGDSAMEFLKGLNQFDRMQVTPGFTAAANYLIRQMQGHGLQTKMLTFPARFDAEYWTALMFQDWEGQQATLDLLEPLDHAQRLVEYRTNRVGLIQRSGPTPPVEGEVVVLHNGEEEEDYEGLDVRAKFVLSDGDRERLHDLAVDERGALGVINDHMDEVYPVRKAGDLQYAVQYTHFWFSKEQKPTFGFVLSPAQGTLIRELVRSGKTVRLRAQVKARLFDGTMTLPMAIIPGETEEQVISITHLCHAWPSANWSASGSAANMEVARTLQSLIANGTLKPPKRTIIFLWPAEMTGTYAYLSTAEDKIPEHVAAIQMETIGENQEVCGSTLLIERPHLSLPSFVDDLLEMIRDAWLDSLQPKTGYKGYTPIRHGVSAWRGATDATILSDPTVGIPTASLVQRPDRFILTSEDTIDKVDPKMLGIVGTWVATWLYIVANAGSDEVDWLGYDMVTRFKGRIAADLAQRIEGGATVLAKRAEFLVGRQEAALDSLLRLAPRATKTVVEFKSECERAAQAELEFAQARCPQGRGITAAQKAPAKVGADDVANMVPVRLYRGPMVFRPFLPRLTREERIAFWRLSRQFGRGFYTLTHLAQYWCDGKRTVAEIADLVEQEAGVSLSNELGQYFQWLVRCGTARLTSR